MNTITLQGKIVFEPPDLTKKHHNQSNWKRVAFVEFDGELCEYYSYFIKNRYGLLLNKAIRKPHVTIINDSVKDLRLNDTKTIEEVDILWEDVKKKWDGKEIDVIIDVELETNGKYWWCPIPHEMNQTLINIRKEIDLGEPYYKFHISIGYPHPRHEEHALYIHRLMKNDLLFA